MAGVTGKNSLSIKKLDVAESKVPALGFNKIRFAHKATLGATTISTTALTTPTEMTANGFVQPNGSVLSQIHLSQFRENFTLVSSLRGRLQEFLSYTLVGANKINLLFSAEDGEIFEGIFDYAPRIGNTIVDASPLVSTGTLNAGATDYNVGTPFQVGLYSSQQVGAVMVFVDNILMFRNTGNNPPGGGVSGDYYEVHSGSGLGQIIRFNLADPTNSRAIVVVSVGSLTERPNGSQLALIESLQGQIDSIVPTVAELAGVPTTDFQATPNNVDLKTFGDRVLTIEAVYQAKVGRVDGSSVPAGQIGEEVLSTVSVATNYPTSGEYGDLTSIPLTAGNWLITAGIQSQLNAASTVTNPRIGISQTSGNSVTGLVSGYNLFEGRAPTSSEHSCQSVPGWILKVTGPTTVYLKFLINYSAGNPRAVGHILARRVS